MIIFLEILQQLSEKIFTDDQDGKKPSSSVMALSRKEYLYAGEVMAMAIVLGGPAPNFLSPLVYAMISGNSSLRSADYFPEDHRWKQIVTKVRTCSFYLSYGDNVMMDRLVVTKQ